MINKYGDVSPRTAGYAAKKLLEAANPDLVTSKFGMGWLTTTDDETLYICPGPLGDSPLSGLCDMCVCNLPHDHLECIKPCPNEACPKECRVIDMMIAREVKRLPGSKTYDQVWGLDDDPEEWTET